MNTEIEIPQKIKRWNWGAFLLCPLWCLWYRVWQGLLLAIPFFGCFVPFWLGATGNQKAWAKNPHVQQDIFLKHQKYWGLIGFTF